MSFCSHLEITGSLKTSEAPRITYNSDLFWSIDDSDYNMREIYEVFYTWCAKNNKKPRFEFKNIEKIVRPTMNGKVIYTLPVLHACEV